MISLEVDLQETLGCPPLTPGQEFWISGLRCYAPARPSAPFARSDGLGAPAVSPQDELNADNLRLHRNFIANLLPPPVLLPALADGPIHSGVTQGVRVNTLAI
jgi:hypothetical protein